MCIAKNKIGKKVMIRTNTAGVHYGTLNQVEDGVSEYNVELKDARRVYQWSGAFTLSELATKGSTKTDSKLSVTIPSIYLKAIEIIEMTDAAFENLAKIKDYQP